MLNRKQHPLHVQHGGGYNEWALFHKSAWSAYTWSFWSAFFDLWVAQNFLWDMENEIIERIYEETDILYPEVPKDATQFWDWLLTTLSYFDELHF